MKRNAFFAFALSMNCLATAFCPLAVLVTAPMLMAAFVVDVVKSK